MILQYWDSITKEDLEFSVSTAALEAKEPLMDHDVKHNYEPDYHTPGNRLSGFNYY